MVKKVWIETDATKLLIGSAYIVTFEIKKNSSLIVN